MIIINLIIGFIIGYSSYKYIHQSNLPLHGPNSKDIVGSIYHFNGKYYTFTPQICFCPLLKNN